MFNFVNMSCLPRSLLKLRINEVSSLLSKKTETRRSKTRSLSGYKYKECRNFYNQNDDRGLRFLYKGLHVSSEKIRIILFFLFKTL